LIIAFPLGDFWDVVCVSLISMLFMLFARLLVLTRVSLALFSECSSPRPVFRSSFYCRPISSSSSGLATSDRPDRRVVARPSEDVERSRLPLALFSSVPSWWSS
jgi:hypothetical protein